MPAFLHLARAIAMLKLDAQRVAVEMAGQLVAGGQIGETLHLTLLLGGFAQHADHALGAAFIVGDAGTGNVKPTAPMAEATSRLSSNCEE